MKDNRDMFYGNYQTGGFTEPNFMPMQGPSGYNMNASYQAYGPNVMPNNNVPNNNMIYGTNTNDYDERITKLERQIRRIDQRLRKLENAGSIDEDITIDNNLYTI